MNNGTKSIMRTMALPLLAIVSSLLMLSACSDDPSAENFYTKKGEMISDYLDNRSDQYSEFITVLKKSGVYGMMAAYGSYTCFAPNNEAMKQFALGRGYESASELPQDVCDTLSWNHIVPMAYFTGDLHDGNIPTANMNERRLTFSSGIDPDNNDNVVYLVNNASRLIQRDDSVENGVVHTIDRVIVPSNNYIPGLMKNDPNISIFYEALIATGLDQKLYEFEDTTYHCAVDSTYGDKINFYRLGGSVNGGEDHYGNYPARREQKFSVFVERNEVFLDKGIDGVPALADYAKTIYDAVYPEDIGLYDEHDYTDPRHPLNRFVAYHILPYYGGYEDWTLSDQNGVELKSVCAVTTVTDLTDWYTTIMPNTIIKMSAPSEGLFINRKGVGTNYTVRGVRVLSPTEMTEIFASTDMSEHEDTLLDNQALNGIYHYIDDILAYDTQTRDVVFNDRIRISSITMSPEFMNAGARGRDKCTGFKVIDGWQIYGKVMPTISVRNRGVWNATYGDCIDVIGQFDVAFRLPPVPTNTYEIRFAYGARNQGGVVQIYFGTKDNMQPMGIPIDFRVYGGDPSIGWVEDIEDDVDANRAIDKAMHNRGYMKEMDSWKQGGSNNLRANAGKLRRILTTQTMENGTEYWIRIKLVNDNPNAETPINYFELCPKSVYAGEVQEDTH